MVLCVCVLSGVVPGFSTLWPRIRGRISQSVDSINSSVLFNESIDLLTNQQARLIPWRVLELA